MVLVILIRSEDPKHYLPNKAIGSEKLLASCYARRKEQVMDDYKRQNRPMTLGSIWARLLTGICHFLLPGIISSHLGCSFCHDLEHTLNQRTLR